MRKILVNAISIQEGGGTVVLENLIRALCEECSDVHWFVIINHKIHFPVKRENITILTFPWVEKSVFHYYYWYIFYLPALLKRLKAELIFSQTNFLPLKSLPCPTLLLVHHAGYFSKKYAALYLASQTSWRGRLEWYLRCYWVRASIQRATHVAVQTQALSHAISDKLSGVNQKVTVIPHGSGLAAGPRTKQHRSTKQVWRIGYITKYGVQKNFEMLFLAIYLLKQQGVDCKLVLTLDPTHPPYRKVQQLINKYDLQHLIENNGEVSPETIRTIYSNLDIFVFPSLCESFGFPLVEAMYYGLPVIAASTASNREILGEGGLFFQGNNASDLIGKIRMIIGDVEYYNQVANYSLKQCQRYQWQDAAKQFGAQIDRLTETV